MSAGTLFRQLHQRFVCIEKNTELQSFLASSCHKIYKICMYGDEYKGLERNQNNKLREITKAKLRNGKKMEDQPLPDCWQMNVSITKAAVLINRAHLLRGPNASYKHERDIFNLKLYLERRHDLQQETMHSNNLFFFTGIKYSVLFLSDEKSSTFI